MEDNLSLVKQRTLLAIERTRLAAQRTYLAWTRTGLAGVAGGVTILRFVVFQKVTHQIIGQGIGSLLVILGILIIGSAYFNYRYAIKKLQIQEGYRGIVFTVTFSLICVSFALLFLAIT